MKAPILTSKLFICKVVVLTSLLFFSLFQQGSARTSTTNFSTTTEEFAPDCPDNLLNNGGFDYDKLSWTIQDAYAYVTTIHDDNSTLSFSPRYGKIGKIYQEIPAVGGTTFNLSFDAGTQWNRYTHRAGLEFLNASRQALSVVDLEVDHDMRGNMPLKWYHLAAEAPAATAYVRVVFSSHDNALKVNSVCLRLGTAEICDNGLDDDGDGLIDQQDTDCGAVCNLINNPEFDEGLSHWNFFIVDSSSIAYLTLDSTAQLSGTNAAYIDIIQEDANAMPIELSNDGHTLLANTPYTLSFEAKAEADKSIGFALLEREPIGSLYLIDVVDLTTAAQTYSFNYTPTTTLSNAEIVLLIFTDSVNLWIDNVAIIDQVCMESTISEICDNGIDDDGDGQVDCADGECASPYIYSISIDDESCPFVNESKINIEAGGGALEYSIDMGISYQDSYVFRDLANGSYPVRVRNASTGCSIDTLVVIATSPKFIALDDDRDGLTNCEERTGIDDPNTVLVPNGNSGLANSCDPIPFDTMMVSGYLEENDGYDYGYDYAYNYDRDYDILNKEDIYGLPDGLGAIFGENAYNSQISGNLKDVLLEGKTYTVLWRRIPNASTTATIEVEEHNGYDDWIPAAGSPFLISDTSFIQQDIIASTNIKRLRFTSSSSVGIEIDAVSYPYELNCLSCYYFTADSYAATCDTSNGSIVIENLDNAPKLDIWIQNLDSYDSWVNAYPLNDAPAEGTYTISNLAAGEYEITVHGYDNNGHRHCLESFYTTIDNLPCSPIEICDNNIDDDGDGLIDMQDMDCMPTAPIVEICDNGIDDDGDGLIDLADADCTPDTTLYEICNNGIDDDLDGLVDLMDTDCMPDTLLFGICTHLIDYDGDGMIDMQHPDCEALCNMINNPEFEENNSNWELYSNMGTSAILTMDSTVLLSGPTSASIDISQASDTPWHLELVNSGYTLVANNPHQISMMAKAEANRSIIVALQLREAPWTVYKMETINLTSLTHIYQFTYIPTDTLANIGLVIQAGHSDTNFWVDNVQIIDQACIASIIPEICDNGIDDDFDGLIDSEDTECVPNIPMFEICNNGIDDDGDGQVDCDDADCGQPMIDMVVPVDPDNCPMINNGMILVNSTGANLEYSIDNGSTYQSSNLFTNLTQGSYQIVVKNTSTGCVDNTNRVLSNPICMEICYNGIDDDGDGLIDCEDADCGQPVIDSMVVTSPNICLELEDGTVYVAATGNNLRYSKDGGITFQNDPFFTDLSFDLLYAYPIIVENYISGCSDIEFVDIILPDCIDTLAPIDTLPVPVIDPDSLQGIAYEEGDPNSLEFTIQILNSPSDSTNIWGVYVRPKGGFDAPANETLAASGQVTIIMEQTAMNDSIHTIQSVHGIWDTTESYEKYRPTNATTSPIEHAHFFVGLVDEGAGIPLETNHETLLFTFQTTQTCPDTLGLFDNNNEVLESYFLDELSRNPGMDLAVFNTSTGVIHNWVGNYAPLAFNCQDLSTNEETDSLPSNPITESVFEFKIQILEPGSDSSNTWGVYVRPKEGFDAPDNESLTASGQVTIIMEQTPMKDSIYNIQQVNGIWDTDDSYGIYRPLSSPSSPLEHTYFFVGLQEEGDNGIPLETNQETLLFTFQTTQACPDTLGLFDNNDPIINSYFLDELQINPGMDLAVFNTSTGVIHNWVGSYAPYAFNCQDLSDNEETDSLPSDPIAEPVFEFKIQILEPETDNLNVWGVYVKPIAGFDNPNNEALLGSGQVTIIMEQTATNDSIYNVEPAFDLFLNTHSRYTPSGSLYDYFSVSLDGGASGALPLETNEETLLFTFQTTQDCPDTLGLFDNHTNPYLLDFQATNLNLGMSFPVFNTSTGKIYNWKSNYAPGAYSCFDCDADGIPDGIEDINGDGLFVCEESVDSTSTPPVPVNEVDSLPTTEIAHCLDGVDNDGDGDIDCEDSDCNRPSILHISPEAPSNCPLNDGEITVIAEGNNLQYSKDNGQNYQFSNVFGGLQAGLYTIRVRDSITSCYDTYLDTIQLLNDLAYLNEDSDLDGLTDCEELSGIDDPSTSLAPVNDADGFTSDPFDACDPSIFSLYDVIYSMPPDVTISCDDSLDSLLATDKMALFQVNPIMDSMGLDYPYDTIPNLHSLSIDYQENSFEGGCNNEWIIVRTWQLAICGSEMSHTQVVTISDSNAPLISCAPDITINCETDSLLFPMVEPTVSDNCSAVELSYVDAPDIQTDACHNVLIRLWTAVDECGNASTCEQRINLVDDIAPVVICAPDMTISCDMDSLLFIPMPPNVSDNCSPAASLALTHEDINTDTSLCGNSILRIWTAIDACGNTSVCEQQINMIDDVAPLIACDSAMTISCEMDSVFTQIMEPTVTDNCSPRASLALTHEDVQTDTLTCGSTIVRIWTAVDECGNVSSCEQLISIIDDVAPIITCDSAMTISCEMDSVFTQIMEPTITDNCSPRASLALTHEDIIIDTLTCGNIMLRIWTAVDDCGNTSSCEQRISIIDDVAPIINCPPTITISDEIDSLLLQVEEPTVFDNCNGVDMMYTDATTILCGTTRDIIRTWTAADACGNTSICEQTISIVDTIAPIVTCAPDITINCDESTVPALSDYPIVDDFMSIDSFALTYEDLTVGGLDPCSSDAGDIVRIWTAVDACGNEAICEQIIIVLNEPSRVYAKLFLEGYYDPISGSMHTQLLDKNLLPFHQPYNTAPWQYTGLDSVLTFSEGIVDWVLLMTRDANGAMLDQATGFVNQAGELVGTDGMLGIPILQAIGSTISIHHRSHLAVLSATPYVGGVYDFTQDGSQALGNYQLKEIGGKYVLYGGDYDASGVINSLDLNLWKTQSSALNEYLSVDGNGSAIVNSLDYNLWTNNRAKVGERLIWY